MGSLNRFLGLNYRSNTMIYIDTEKYTAQNCNQIDRQQSNPCIWMVILISVAMIIFYNSNPYSAAQVEYTSLSQLYNFKTTGYIAKPTQQLNSNYSIMKWPQIYNSGTPPMGTVTAVFTTSGRYENLHEALSTFFTFNTYPIERVIVVNDGFINRDLEHIASQYPNVSWIATNEKVGQVAAVDIAYRFVKTQYVFHSEDDWKFLKNGFIQYCFHIFARDPKISGVWLSNVLKLQKLIPSGPLFIATYKQNGRYSGHSFNPSVHKMSQYRKIPGGFSNLTFFSSYGKGAGIAEQVISIYFQMRGYYYAQSHIFFTQHATAMGSGQFKFFPRDLNYKTGEKLQKVFNDFDNWCKRMDKQKRFELDIPNLDQST